MREIKIGQVYRHFKGNMYYVEDIAIHSETQEEYAVYKALYGDYKTYIRPKDMFLEEADLNRADNIYKQKYRFQLIDLSTGDLLE